MAKVHGYLRVSTACQKPDRQINGLRELCDELHIEQVSGAAKVRPVFDKLVKCLEPDDTLAVWDLDRAFRSTIDAITTADALRARGVNLRIVTMHIDTATEDGEFVYTVMAALAQFERRRIIRRTKEGMAAARKRGKRIGRPRKLAPNHIDDARRELERSPHSSVAAIALRLRCSPRTLSRALVESR